MTFKVGDRVRVTGFFDPIINRMILGNNFEDRIFTISDVSEIGDEPSYGLCSTSAQLRFFSNELMLARVKNNKLSRKLYPNATEDGEWLNL